MPEKYQELRFQPMQNTLARNILPDGTIYRMDNATVEDGRLGARAGFGQHLRRLATPAAWSNTDLCYGVGYGRYKTYEFFIAAIRPVPATYLKTRIYVMDASTGAWATVTNDDWTERTNSRWNFATFDKWIYGVNETDGLWRFDMTIGAATDGWLFQELTLTSIVTPVSTAALVKPPYETRLWSAANDTEAVTAGAYGYDYATSVIDADGNWTLAGWINKGTPTRTEAWFTCDIEDATSYDFSKKRYISTEVVIENPTLDTAGGSREQENPRILTEQSYYKAYIADDATAPFGTWTDAKWKECRVIATPTTYATGPDRVDGVRVDIDLDSALGAPTAPDLTVIKRIAIRVPVRSGNIFSLKMGPLELGGTFLNKPLSGNYLSLGEGDPVSYYAATAKDITYLVQYFHTGTSAESAPSKYIVNASKALGRPLNQDGMYLGSGVTFDLPAPDGVTYNRTRLWRKRISDTGHWYCLNDVAAATTVTDYLVDASSDPVAWPTTVTKRAEGYRFGSVVTQDIAPDCVTVWKTHMVLGADNLIYFSEANRPGSYYFAPDDSRNPTKGSIDTTDTTLGRTLYMSNDRSDSCLGFVSRDILYAVGRRGVYAFIGDSAITGSGFRRLPGSFGAVQATAITEYRDGVLVGSQSGLYYHEASRALAESNNFSTAQVEELTKDVRVSWRALLTTNPDNDLVICEDGEGGILCVRGSRYLYLNPSQQWEEGTLNEDALLDGDPTGGDSDGGDTDVTVDPVDEPVGPATPIDGGESETPVAVCYNDSALFTITKNWDGTAPTASPAVGSGTWGTDGNKFGDSAGSINTQTGPGTFASSMSATATITFTITYTGAAPAPTYLRVRVDSVCGANVSWDTVASANLSRSSSATVSDGMGTSMTLTNNEGVPGSLTGATAAASGSRTYLLACSAAGVATLSITPTFSVSASMTIADTATVQQSVGGSANYTITYLGC